MGNESNYIFYFEKNINYLQMKHFPSITIIFIITLLLYIPTVTSQSSKCIICQRCTNCNEDVLYDPTVDTLYESIATKQPSIRTSYPLKITKTNNLNSVNYSFFFSNNYNATIQIIPKNNPILLGTSVNSNTVSSTTQINTTNKGSQNADGFSIDTSQLVQVNKVVPWTAINNAAAILLQYSKKHFYLGQNIAIVSLSLQTSINTYSAQVSSQSGLFKLIANINPENNQVTVLNLSYLGNVSPSPSTSSQPVVTINQVSGSNNVASSKNKNDGLNNNLKNNGTVATANNLGSTASSNLANSAISGITNYLQSKYPSLNKFILQSYTTTDNTTFSLQYEFPTNKNVKYIFKVIKTAAPQSNLRGSAPSASYLILQTSQISDGNTNDFIQINDPLSFSKDAFASSTIDVMTKTILPIFNLNNVKLVSISSAAPYYKLNYQDNNNNYQFLVSYDLLTNNLKVISQNINNINNNSTNRTMNLNPASAHVINQKTNTAASVTSNTTNIPTASTTVSKTTQVLLVPAKQRIPDAQNISNTKNGNTPAAPTPAQPSNSAFTPIFTFINFRTDPVFLKALSLLNSIKPISNSDIIKVSYYSLSSNVKRYNLTIDYHLESNRLLQFLVDYDAVANTVIPHTFIYQPDTPVSDSQYTSLDLQTISKNTVVLSIVSQIFVDFPQYFSGAISNIKQVLSYPPFFKISYLNSVHGYLTFSCSYNYFLSKSSVIGVVLIDNKNIINPSTSVENFTNLKEISMAGTTNNISQLSSKSNDGLVAATLKEYKIVSNNSISNNSQTASVQPTLDTLTKIAAAAFAPSNNTNSSHSSANASPVDYFCINSSNGRCLQCVFRFFYDSQQAKCMPISDKCLSFNSQTGECLSCFSGYMLNKGLCSQPKRI